MTALLLAGGWLLIGMSAALASAMYRTDRRLQAFRAPGQPPSAYRLVPVRWKRSLYTAEGRPLVARAWGLMALMYILALAGVMLLSRGVEALP